MKKGTIVSAFKKKWTGTEYIYEPRACPYCQNGTMNIGGVDYECAACEGTGLLFRNGRPDTNEKLLAAAPSVYADMVRKWTLSISVVEEELPF